MSGSINYCQNLWAQFGKIQAAQTACAEAISRANQSESSDFSEIQNLLENFHIELQKISEFWEEYFVEYRDNLILRADYDAIVEMGNYGPPNYLKPIDRVEIKNARAVKLDLFEYKIASKDEQRVAHLISLLSDLEELNIQASGISDITELSVLKNLKHINVGRTDLGQLAQITSLEEVVVRLYKNSDVSKLAGLHQMKTFNPAIGDDGVDFSSLAGAFPQLENLHVVSSCTEQQLTDLLAAGPTSELIIWSVKYVSSLKPLAGNPNLKKVILSSCGDWAHKFDLSPIVDIPNIEEIIINNTEISNSGPLVELLKLKPDCKVKYTTPSAREDYNAEELRSLGAEVNE